MMTENKDKVCVKTEHVSCCSFCLDSPPPRFVFIHLNIFIYFPLFYPSLPTNNTQLAGVAEALLEKKEVDERELEAILGKKKTAEIL